MATTRPRTPDQYAQEKLQRAQQLWTGELGALQRSIGEKLAPGIDPFAWAGFGTNSSGPNEALNLAAFWELGWGDVSGGTTQEPPPHCQGTAENEWCKRHDDYRVVSVLERNASMEPEGWKLLPDQTAVTIVSLLEHGYGVARKLDERIRPAGDLTGRVSPATAGGLFFTYLCFVGFSAGGDKAAAQINRYANELATVPEDGRVGALLWLYANAARRGEFAEVNAGEYSDPFYGEVRTWQKLAAGQLLARAMRADESFFGFNAVADWVWVSRMVTAVGYGLSRDVGDPNPATWTYVGPPSNWKRVAGGALLALAVAAGGALAWQWWEEQQRQQQPRVKQLGASRARRNPPRGR